MLKALSMTFSDSRILDEGQKDGEKNIPEMGSYQPAPFEQVLIANGERRAQQAYQKASARIAKHKPLFETYKKHWEDLEARITRVTHLMTARKQELGRDLAIPFPYVYHLALIVFLGIGEFPLNTIVFRLFGEAEFLTYVMASTLAVTIPLLGMFVGIHLRITLPRQVGNVVVGLLPVLAVGAALYSISMLRNTYISSQGDPTGAAMASTQENMVYALFAINMLVFCAAIVASFFAHDPDEKLDFAHYSLIHLDRKRNKIRKKAFRFGSKLNVEIQLAKSHIEMARARTSERVALYRSSNVRHRQLLPPPTFRKSPEFKEFEFWPEVSVTSAGSMIHGG